MFVAELVGLGILQAYDPKLMRERVTHPGLVFQVQMTRNVAAVWTLLTTRFQFDVWALYIDVAIAVRAYTKGECCPDMLNTVRLSYSVSCIRYVGHITFVLQCVMHQIR